MDIVKVDEQLTEKFASEIPDLVYATGPVSYDYHFDRRSLFDAIVLRSWRTPETLFGADATHVAVDGEDLLGIMISFHAPEFRERGAALGAVWRALVEEGKTNEEEIGGVLERADHASWLNPVTRPGIYYIHALAVKPEHRGKQIGAKLITHAMELGRGMNCSALELDVLSDNPAVNFYQSMGLELLVESRAPKPSEYGVPPECRMGIAL